jgi:hypothetical protein
VGFTVMAPIFQRDRDGREIFWGFVTAAIRLPEALGRAGLNELFWSLCRRNNELGMSQMRDLRPHFCGLATFFGLVFWP